MDTTAWTVVGATITVLVAIAARQIDQPAPGRRHGATGGLGAGSTPAGLPDERMLAEVIQAAAERGLGRVHRDRRDERDTKAVIGTVLAAAVGIGVLLLKQLGNVETEIRAVRTELGDVRVFRTMWIADFGGSGSPVSVEVDHRFRRKWIAFGRTGSPSFRDRERSSVA